MRVSPFSVAAEAAEAVLMLTGDQVLVAVAVRLKFSGSSCRQHPIRMRLALREVVAREELVAAMVVMAPLEVLLILEASLH
jgi:hypothetical protein